MLGRSPVTVQDREPLALRWGHWLLHVSLEGQPPLADRAVPLIREDEIQQPGLTPS